MMLLSPCFFWMRMQGPSFNSIKVRLNLPMTRWSQEKRRFQFHKGTIKPMIHTINAISIHRFNSIKVRLNLVSRRDSHLQQHTFQFHKGTIKPCGCRWGQGSLSVFQFHKGTIKPVDAGLRLISIMFQFHKGTIKPIDLWQGRGVRYVVSIP